METIEERADMILKSCPKHITKNNEGVLNYHVYEDDALKAVKRALVKQDHISRAEERERCIQAAQEWYCIRCCDTSGEECHYCHIKEHIRKAIEEGGQDEENNVQ